MMDIFLCNMETVYVSCVCVCVFVYYFSAAFNRFQEVQTRKRPGVSRRDCPNIEHKALDNETM